MRTLYTVEGILGGILLGLFVGCVGVGVGNFGSFTGGADNDAVPLSYKTGEGHDCEDVANGIPISINNQEEGKGS